MIHLTPGRVPKDISNEAHGPERSHGQIASISQQRCITFLPDAPITKVEGLEACPQSSRECCCRIRMEKWASGA